MQVCRLVAAPAVVADLDLRRVEEHPPVHRLQRPVERHRAWKLKHWKSLAALIGAANRGRPVSFSISVRSYIS